MFILVHFSQQAGGAGGGIVLVPKVKSCAK